MAKGRLSEISNHLLEMQAETGELTEAQVEGIIRMVGDTIAEQYKVKDMPKLDAIIEAQIENTVKTVTETMAENKQRKELLEEIIIPAIDNLNNTQIK